MFKQRVGRKVKLRSFLAVVLILSLLVLGSTLVQAQWSALDSGYAVTTDYHGVDVPLGVEVTATAGTTNSGVKKVEFRWLDPYGNEVFGLISVSVFGPYTTPNVPPGVPQEIVDWALKNPGIDVYYAQNTQSPERAGDWAVQAIFYDSGGRGHGPFEDKVAIRATSFNVIPEAPSTIVILLGMFGALGVFALKKKQRVLIRMPL